MVCKAFRICRYYVRLLTYAATTRTPVFHILWNNKLEFFDRTILMLYYKCLGKRVVCTVHNVNILERDGGDDCLNRWTLKVQYHLADHLFVHTRLMKEELKRDFKIPEKRVSVIPFGLNDTMPRTTVTRAQARARLGLNPAGKVLLFFGNIAPYKGVEYLIEAFSSVHIDIPDSQLLIAGRAKGAERYWSQMQELIRPLQQSGALLVDHRYIPDEETELYFKSADVLILPYTHLFQSGVLSLSYSFGLPVIATDVGSLKEDIVPGETGVLCRPKDSAALADAIRSYFVSDLYAKLDKRRVDIREFAMDRFCWSRVASTSQSVYKSLLNREV